MESVTSSWDRWSRRIRRRARAGSGTVAHTRSRCEKKVVDFCDRNEIETTLPQYRSVRKYRGNTVTFEKPLFPGYVFLRMETSQRAKVAQNDMVANVLMFRCQDEFEAQLSAVMQAGETRVRGADGADHPSGGTGADPIGAVARVGGLRGGTSRSRGGAFASGFHRPGCRCANGGGYAGIGVRRDEDGRTRSPSGWRRRRAGQGRGKRWRSEGGLGGAVDGRVYGH